MIAPEPDNKKGSAVIVVDTLSFRRAGLLAILSPWAISHECSLLPVDRIESTQSASCDMFILNLGGQSFSSAIHPQWIDHIREQPSRTPFVIISDREEPEETLRAFDAGASGFIPTSLNPELVFHALTFIISGGSFFPPSALLSFARDKEPSSRSPDRRISKSAASRNLQPISLA